jgi:hypothetical protein
MVERFFLIFTAWALVCGALVKFNAIKWESLVYEFDAEIEVIEIIGL